MAVETEHLSEIQELFQTAQDTISCLFRLSVAIRAATNEDRYAKSMRKRDNPYDECFDIAHVGHKFPKLRETPWLEARLGRAITRRREFIRYSKDHSLNLARGAERSVNEPITAGGINATNTTNEEPVILRDVASRSQQPQSTLGSTEASAFDPIKFRQIDATETVEEEASESSYASTEITAENEGHLKIPPIPEQGEGGREFFCPYCSTARSYKGKSKKCRKYWK